MRAILIGFLGLGLMSGAQALTVQIDTTYDGGYFAAHPDALTALNKAASDLSAAIKPSLNAVPSDTYIGSVGDPADPTVVSVDWSLSFINPSNAAQTVTLGTFNFAADVFKVYVGARALTTGTLGEGSGWGIDAVVTVPNGFLPEELAAAATQAQNSSNSGMRGTKGPLFSQDQVVVGDEEDHFTMTLNTGAMGGVISFSNTVNWHFDINTLPSTGESDFYSVALHELIHTLGLGTSKTWDDKITGKNWNGTAVGALTDGGINIISTDGAHIAEGTKSRVLIDVGGTYILGGSQEVVMDPTLTTGDRKTLTQLDLAFLKDLGYDTATVVAVPEPGTVVLLGLSVFAVGLVHRRKVRL